MTLKEVSRSLYRCSVAGYFNHEKHGLSWLEVYIKRNVTAVRKPFIFEIAMLDGWWLCSVEQYAPGEYDYYIPDNREQEKRLRKALEKA